MGKKGDLSDFERGMVVGARRADLSISETAWSTGIFREWSEKEKISCERQFKMKMPWCQRRMDRLVRDDRKTTVTQITTRYNQGMQNSISEHTITSNPEADDLQQQKTTPGAAPVR